MQWISFLFFCVFVCFSLYIAVISPILSFAFYKLYTYLMCMNNIDEYEGKEEEHAI